MIGDLIFIDDPIESELDQAKIDYMLSIIFLNKDRHPITLEPLDEE